MAAELRGRGVHVLLETCGHFDWERFRRYLLPHLSTIYFDAKLADPEAHRAHTGVDNRRILDNLGRLVDEGACELAVRVPLVPEVTATLENLAAIARLVRSLGLPPPTLLPCNPLWLSKRRALGMATPYAHAAWMDPQEVARLRVFVEEDPL